MRRLSLGVAGAIVILVVYGVVALGGSYANKAGDFWGDNATYYMMAQSLAHDGDLAYRREDYRRVIREFPSGPNGLFLKKGQTITGIQITARAPFLKIPPAVHRQGS